MIDDDIEQLLEYAEPEEQLELVRELGVLAQCQQTEDAEKSLYEFAKQAWSIIEPGIEMVESWHLGLISEHLQAVDDGQIENLLINQPPGTTKSILTSVLWPAWIWTHQPTARFLCATYEQGLSTRDAVKSRMLLDSEWYQRSWSDKVQFTRDQNQKTYFQNKNLGWRLSTTPGSRGLGEHPSHIIVDDPQKVRGAHSDLDRQMLLDWWTGTVSTRGVGRGVGRVVVAQRLHERDLPGYLLSVGGWEHICIPMRYEPGRMKTTIIGGFDPRTEEGELLCPQLFDETKVLGLEKSMGPYYAAGQLQQRPAPPTGGTFDRAMFRYFRVEDIKGRECAVLTGAEMGDRRVWLDECFWFQACDTAMKLRSEHDYTAIGTFLLTPPPMSLLVYDMLRDKIPVPKQYGVMIAQRTKYPQLKFQAVEDKASGIGLIQEGRLKGTPFLLLKADGDKVARCVSITMMYANGMVYHYAGTPWLEKFEHEITTFPLAEHDDMTDVLAYSGILTQGRQHANIMGNMSLGAWAGPIPDADEQQWSSERPPTLAEQMTGRRAGEQPERPW